MTIAELKNLLKDIEDDNQDVYFYNYSEHLDISNVWLDVDGDIVLLDNFGWENYKSNMPTTLPRKLY